MEIGKSVYCVDESVYSDHITKRGKYEVFQSEKGQLRIKSNHQKLVWIPKDCFVDDKLPEIVNIQIDDEIKDPENDCVEVTVEFSDGEKRWTAFATINWVRNLFNDHTNHVIGSGFIFLRKIDRENIKTAIKELDRFNELIELARSYDS